MKITGLTLMSVTCEDITSEKKSELPINYKGIGREDKVYNILPLIIGLLFVHRFFNNMTSKRVTEYGLQLQIMNQ